MHVVSPGAWASNGLLRDYQQAPVTVKLCGSGEQRARARVLAPVAD